MDAAAAHGTAFVLAGGGSFGAVQAGMLRLPPARGCPGSPACRRHRSSRRRGSAALQRTGNRRGARERAIPAAFPPVRIGAQYLMDGAVASNTPIRTAIELGATRLVVLPTGYACALHSPPRGALALMLHAITLLTARQLASDLERYGSEAEIITVPPLCPLAVSPYDFSRGGELIERAAAPQALPA